MLSVSLRDYDFELPAESIAEFPLSERDQAKLLVYRQGTLDHKQFFQLDEELPNNALLVYNDTKVIPARLLVYRESGARIELLLLEPLNQIPTETLMNSTGSGDWKAMIGGLKKWKEGEVLYARYEGLELQARLLNRNEGEVSLSWNENLSFADVLEKLGRMPLPPYIKREAEETDKERYQTVYAKNQGAVAAPTAGLHFTANVFEKLKAKGIKTLSLTLHVGAGTFQPVKVDNPTEHPMHNERMVIQLEQVQQLAKHDGPVIPVGTTSMRTLESLYWWGAQLAENPDAEFFIPKLLPYQSDLNLSRKEAFEQVVAYFERKGLQSHSGHTEILIMPGYRFRVCTMLITNFHLPETTLILLVAAFIGDDWRKVYNTALEQGYRFLSFGDSSLLIP
ncbi:MAG: S-adenosylmethionine:tRNA ribosyltransferase-isomerase [Bacteroidetes bacterium]|nr:MAG: S-adenosylmethionine:tRNA ribosyltransferase-isomerase [Bacteroidota bacterium]